MKILLVNPPNCGRSIPEEQYGIASLKQLFKGEPFNLEVLAGPLIGHDVLIFDGKCEAPENFRKVLDDFRPDVVGFTSLTCEANTVIRQAAEVRRQSRAVLVVGGCHATYDPEYFNRSEFDYIVVGLGKKSFAQLIEALAAQAQPDPIPGVARTSPGKPLVFTPRRFGRADLLDDIPPRYDLVAGYRDQYHLEQLGLAMGFVITAYGCTHDCSFCTIPKMAGGKYLTHSPDAVLRDIGLLGDIPFVRLVDANTFGSARQAGLLCDKILQAGLKRKFFADVRADTVVKHVDLMKKWKEAGLYAVVVGFEDIADDRLAAYNKKYRGNVIRKAVDILHELGIVIIGDFIASPADTEEDFAKLERFIVSHRIEVPVVSVLTPMPGTALYETLKEEIVISDLDYYTFTNAVTRTKMPEELFYRTYADLVKRLHEKPHTPH
ncbi:MAG: radical SAM protein [Smithellaceae bacterium]|nr:radical SAM protein [Smithellaceae bacterium]NLX51215.1 radical SAM protein [Deltaproteobacteria bacterium]